MWGHQRERAKFSLQRKIVVPSRKTKNSLAKKIVVSQRESKIPSKGKLSFLLEDQNFFMEKSAFTRLQIALLFGPQSLIYKLELLCFFIFYGSIVWDKLILVIQWLVRPPKIEWTLKFTNQICDFDCSLHHQGNVSPSSDWSEKRLSSTSYTQTQAFPSSYHWVLACQTPQIMEIIC